MFIHLNRSLQFETFHQKQLFIVHKRKLIVKTPDWTPSTGHPDWETFEQWSDSTSNRDKCKGACCRLYFDDENKVLNKCKTSKKMKNDQTCKTERKS